MVAGVTISGTEDEDPAEYFDSHEDAGELLDPPVDTVETEEATKAKLKELDRMDGIRARFVAREFKGDETMYDVFAPSSTPSTGRVIDYSSLKKAYHTFTADVTHASFHADEDEECYVNPPAEWLQQQAALWNPTSVLCGLRKQLCGWSRAGTR